MSVFASIATIFIENLIAVAGILGAVFMVVEYFRRARNASLLYFAASFASIGTGFLIGFVGQLLYVYLDASAGGGLVLSQQYFTSFSALFLVLGLVHAYRLRHQRTFIAVSVGVFALTVVYGSAFGSTISLIQGIPINVLTISQAAGKFLPWILANIVLLILSGVSYARSLKTNRKYASSDLYLFRSGLVGLLVLSFSAAILTLDLGGYLWVNFALLIVQMLLLFFGGVAKGHPDDIIAEHPENVINRSLAFKALTVNTSLFWVLAFALVAITASYFVTSIVNERRQVMVRDLRLFTTTHHTASEHLLESAEQFAEHPALADLVRTGNASSVSNASELMAMIERRDISLIVLDADGRVVYGGSRSNVVTGDYSRSEIVRQAFEGHAVAGVEHDSSLNAWSLRAGAPIILEDGTVGGVVIGVDAVHALGLDTFEEFTVSRATGFGYLSARNELVYEAGMSFDQLTLHTFQQAVQGTAIRGGDLPNGDIFFVAGVQRTDGTPDGFFYIHLSRASINAEIFQILSVVMIFVTLFVLVVASVLIFSMLIVLRPVRELREAATRIEHADYDLHIAYDKPDELGQLAAAFNSMTATIKDRTSHLNEALRQQRDFLTHTAQEMRNPLNIFRWSLEMLRFGDTGQLNKEQLELVEQMHQTNERIRRLITNLVDTSHIEKGTFELHRDFVSIDDVIDDAAGAVSVRIREKNINLHWNRPEESLPKVYADQERLYQVLLNIISNAVKYTHRNGHIEVDVKETETSGPSAREGKFVQVRVEDNGRGIPKDQQSKIFTRFFRARNVVAEEIEGAGLGLYISKRIVDMHGGELWFESSEGDGSTFTFTIPQKKP